MLVRMVLLLEIKTVHLWNVCSAQVAGLQKDILVALVQTLMSGCIVWEILTPSLMSINWVVRWFFLDFLLGMLILCRRPMSLHDSTSQCWEGKWRFFQKSIFSRFLCCGRRSVSVVIMYNCWRQDNLVSSVAMITFYLIYGTFEFCLVGSIMQCSAYVHNIICRCIISYIIIWWLVM